MLLIAIGLCPAVCLSRFCFAGCVVAYRLDGLEGVAHTEEELDPADAALTEWPEHFESFSASTDSDGAGGLAELGLRVRHLLPVVVIRPPVLSGLSVRRTAVLSIFASPTDVSVVGIVGAELGVAVCSLRDAGRVLTRSRRKAPTFCCGGFFSSGVSSWAGTSGGELDVVSVGRTSLTGGGVPVTAEELCAVSSISPLPTIP
jgi:hypothetical protein